MASPTTDRRLGLAGNTAYKVPVATVATANVVQSGEQTITGYALKAVNAAGIPDRVLCVGQTDGTKNGIWDVSTGSWTRSIDANGNYDLQSGSQVMVAHGTNAGFGYYLSTLDPITVGTTAQTWVASPTANVLGALSPTSGAGIVGFSPAVDYSGTLGGFNVGAYLNGLAAVNKFRGSLLLAGNTDFNLNPSNSEIGHLFEVVNDNTSFQCISFGAYGIATNGNNMHWNRYYGTAAVPTQVGTGAFLMSMGFRAYQDTGGLSQSYAAFQCLTTEAITSLAHGMKFQFEVTSNGSSTRRNVVQVYAASTDGAVLQLGDATALAARVVNAGNSGLTQLHGSLDQAGGQISAYGSAHATLAAQMQMRAAKYTFSDVSANEYMNIDPSTNSLNLGMSGSARLNVRGASTQLIFQFQNNASTGMVYGGAANLASTAGENGANAFLYVRKDSTTSRSINAAGTINASGADYAEYMRKAPGCGEIAKGQIVGVDAQGELTDKWADATTFLVKSTNPSYVGGDTHGTEEAIGMERPVEPAFTNPDYVGPDHPGTLAADEQGTRDPQVELDHVDAEMAFDVAWAAHLEAASAARARFLAEDMAEHEKAMADFAARLEAARAPVDRIAFSGQVPVNVLGAKPGDYIVPVQKGEDIAGLSIAKPTFEQYQAAVGKAIAIEADGRARIIVKVA